MDIFGVAPWVVLTAVATWSLQALAHRREMRKISLEHEATVDASRDDLAIELLSTARAEVMQARSEMEGLREEIRALRALEQHFYHFQQSLEHLEAILHAEGPAAREIAERNAKAFLARMKRLQEAKGTIANEVQRMDAGLKQTERKIRDEGGQL